MGSNYWSCSRFADWLRGTPKPIAGTSQEWNVWKKKAQAKKTRYWLAEEALDAVQSCVRWPVEFVNDILHYISNRWVYQTHKLSSRLKPGQWHEFDSRILHCLFDELVNFVEVEQAQDCLWMSGEKHQNEKGFVQRILFTVGRWRRPELGLEYLRWAADLKNDEDWIDKDDPAFGKPTMQALVAQETLALYTWWKERPNRPDPMDASGWTVHCGERHKEAVDRGEDSLFLFEIDESEEDREQTRKTSELCHKMEQEQEDEDTEMLIRLVTIRKGLWT